MKTELEVETEKPEKIREAVQPSLNSNGKVTYSLETSEDSLKIKVRTEGLGPLRGCTDTVFRLVSLAEKLY
ncbi:MAG: KEOPS complex subunit Pcc1 [Candidatus Nanohalobium sp.]